MLKIPSTDGYNSSIKSLPTEKSIQKITNYEDKNIKDSSFLSIHNMVQNLGNSDELAIAFLQDIYEGVKIYLYHQKKAREASDNLLEAKRIDLQKEIEDLKESLLLIDESSVSEEVKTYKQRQQFLLDAKLDLIKKLK